MIKTTWTYRSEAWTYRSTNP